MRQAEQLAAAFLGSKQVTTLIKSLETEKVAKGDHLAYYKAKLEVLKALQAAITEEMLTPAPVRLDPTLQPSIERR